MSSSNWYSSTDGSIIESEIRSYVSANGETVDLEFGNTTVIGLVIEAHTTMPCVIIKHIEESSKLRKGVVNVGDVLVSINGRYILDDECEDIFEFLRMIDLGNFSRRLRFLCVQKCPLESYKERIAKQSKIQKDRFGFSRSVEYLTSERQFYLNSVQKEVFEQRDLDWVDYLKSIGGPDNLKPAGVFKPSLDLKSMVRRGIPAAFRPSVWLQISLGSVHRLSFCEGYYAQLLARAEGGELDPRVADDIEKDVDRTFPDHDYFMSGEGISCLRRVLKAYAVHNTEIGYCQSLNFLAGTMLLYMQEEDAFWLFVTVIDTLLPRDYYSKSMVGTYVDQFVFSRIVEKHLPNIHACLFKANLQLPLITVQWFMCIFVNTLRPEVALRVWDIFLNEGSKVLFRIAIALFKLSENKILAAKDPGDLFSIVKDIGRDIVDADFLISSAYRSHDPSSFSHQAARFRSSSTVASGGALSNPRLRSLSLMGQVPSDLVGLGLAHVGPSAVIEANSRSRTDSGSSSSPSSSHLEDASIRIRTSSVSSYSSSSTSSSMQMHASFSTGSIDSMAANNANTSNNSSATMMESPALRLRQSMSRRRDSIPPRASSSSSSLSSLQEDDRGGQKSRAHSNNKFVDASDDVLADTTAIAAAAAAGGISSEIQLVSDASSSEASKAARSKSFLGGGILSSSTSSKSKKDYRSFKRKDIEKWRNQYRPELEQRFWEMETTRRKWREEDASENSSEREEGTRSREESEMDASSMCEDEEEGTEHKDESFTEEGKAIAAAATTTTAASAQIAATAATTASPEKKVEEQEPAEEELEEDDGELRSVEQQLISASPNLWSWLFSSKSKRKHASNSA